MNNYSSPCGYREWRIKFVWIEVKFESMREKKNLTISWACLKKRWNKRGGLTCQTPTVSHSSNNQPHKCCWQPQCATELAIISESKEPFSNVSLLCLMHSAGYSL